MKDKILNSIFGIIFMLSPFYGILLTILAVRDVENYITPYKFSFLFGGIGIILSYLISSRLEPTVLRVNKNIKSYSRLKFYFAIGFIGIFLLIGVKFNSLNATLQNTYKVQITNKTQRKYRYMSAGYNKFHFVINNKPVEIRCNRDIWEKEDIGDIVDLNFYKSIIGFDYWKLNKNY